MFLFITYDTYTSCKVIYLKSLCLHSNVIGLEVEPQLRCKCIISYTITITTEIKGIMSNKMMKPNAELEF